MKRNEDSLRDLWDHVKYTNFHIIGIPEGKERVRGEGREPLADKAGESTLLSRSGGEKGLR